MLWFLTTLYRRLGSHKMGAPSHPRAGPCRGEMSPTAWPLLPSPSNLGYTFCFHFLWVGITHSALDLPVLSSLCSLPRKSFSPGKVYPTPSLKPAHKAAVSGAPSPISSPHPYYPDTPFDRDTIWGSLESYLGLSIFSGIAVRHTGSGPTPS